MSIRLEKIIIENKNFSRIYYTEIQRLSKHLPFLKRLTSIKRFKFSLKDAKMLRIQKTPGLIVYSYFCIDANYYYCFFSDFLLANQLKVLNGMKLLSRIQQLLSPVRIKAL